MSVNYLLKPSLSQYHRTKFKLFFFFSLVVEPVCWSWIFAKSLCILTGFKMYFIGLSSIYLLACISLERCLAISLPFDSNYILSKSLINKQVGLSLFVGFFWSVLPFFGWSHYSYEGMGVSCSVEWDERSFNVISYNVVILVFAFLIPCFCILYTDVCLICVVIIIETS